MTLQDIIDNFAFLDDWQDRYQLIIDLGKQLPQMDEALKNDQTKVTGCMSQVWLVVESADDGVLHIIADSDAHIVRGLIGILRAIYDGKSADEILGIDAKKIFSDLGLDTHISPNRRGGLDAMNTRILAEAAKIKG